MLLQLVDRLPTLRAAYTFEVKWDGFRAIAFIDHGRLYLQSRNLRDLTPDYPQLAQLPAALMRRDVVLDGELVGFGANGRPDFRLAGKLMDRVVAALPALVRATPAFTGALGRKRVVYVDPVVRST